VNLGSNDITSVSERDGLVRIVVLQGTPSGVEIGVARIERLEAQQKTV